MDEMLDGVARILASSISRRDAFRKIAAVVGTAALWAVVGKQDVFAATCNSCCATSQDDHTPRICPPGITCCDPLKGGPPAGPGNSNAMCRATVGNSVTVCCSKGQCACPSGCSSSTGGSCSAAAGCVIIG